MAIQSEGGGELKARLELDRNPGRRRFCRDPVAAQWECAHL